MNCQGCNQEYDFCELGSDFEKELCRECVEHKKFSKIVYTICGVLLVVTLIIVGVAKHGLN